MSYSVPITVRQMGGIVDIRQSFLLQNLDKYTVNIKVFENYEEKIPFNVFINECSKP